MQQFTVHIVDQANKRVCIVKRSGDTRQDVANALVTSLYGEIALAKMSKHPEQIYNGGYRYYVDGFIRERGQVDHIGYFDIYHTHPKSKTHRLNRV